MKRSVAIPLAVALFILAFGWGFAVNFPQAPVTRAIEASVNASPVLAISLAPVRLTVTGLRSDRLTVREAGAPGGPPLLTLTDVRLAFRPALWRGAPLQAALGTDGSVSGFFAWDGSDVTVDELSVRLEDLPLPLGASGLTVKGRVRLSGHFRPSARPANTRAELPEGELRGRAEAVEVSGITVAGTALPVTRLQELEIRLRTGKSIQIERLEAQGDLQGTVQGSVTPNLERILESRLALTLSASMRAAWIQDMGALRPIVEGFFPGGRIEGALGGTAGSPAWTPARGGR